MSRFVLWLSAAAVLMMLLPTVNGLVETYPWILNIRANSYMSPLAVRVNASAKPYIVTLAATQDTIAFREGPPPQHQQDGVSSDEGDIAGVDFTGCECVLQDSRCRMRLHVSTENFPCGSGDNISIANVSRSHAPLRGRPAYRCTGIIGTENSWLRAVYYQGIISPLSVAPAACPADYLEALLRGLVFNTGRIVYAFAPSGLLRGPYTEVIRMLSYTDLVRLPLENHPSLAGTLVFGTTDVRICGDDIAQTLTPQGYVLSNTVFVAADSMRHCLRLPDEIFNAVKVWAQLNCSASSSLHEVDTNIVICNAPVGMAIPPLRVGIKVPGGTSLFASIPLVNSTAGRVANRGLSFTESTWCIVLEASVVSDPAGLGPEAAPTAQQADTQLPAMITLGASQLREMPFLIDPSAGDILFYVNNTQGTPTPAPAAGAVASSSQSAQSRRQVVATSSCVAPVVCPPGLRKDGQSNRCIDMDCPALLFKTFNDETYACEWNSTLIIGTVVVGCALIICELWFTWSEQSKITRQLQRAKRRQY